MRKYQVTATIILHGLDVTADIEASSLNDAAHAMRQRIRAGEFDEDILAQAASCGFDIEIAEIRRAD